MTSAERGRAEEPHGTRSRILGVALDLFSTHGYSATSIRQIAREVGVRESALYTHFKSKQEILETLFEHYGPSQARESLQAMTPEMLREDPCGTFRRFLERMIEAWSRPEELKMFRLAIVESFHGKGSMCGGFNSSVESVKSRMREIFSLLSRQGVLPRAAPEFLVREFMGPLFLMRQELIMGHQAGDFREVMRAFAHEHVSFFFRDHERERAAKDDPAAEGDPAAPRGPEGHQSANEPGQGTRIQG